MRMSRPGPPGQVNTAHWRQWLLPAAGLADVLALLALPRAAAPGMPLTYTRFLADVGAGAVRAVTIGPAGQVTGTLAGGRPFTTTIPVTLGGNGLAGGLAAHHVQVTATATAAMSFPALSALLYRLASFWLVAFAGWLVLFRLRHRPARGDSGIARIMPYPTLRTG